DPQIHRRPAAASGIAAADPLGSRIFLMGRRRRPDGSVVFSTGSRPRTQWVGGFFYWVTAVDPMGSPIFLLGRRPRPDGSAAFPNGSEPATRWVRGFFYWLTDGDLHHQCQ